MRQTNSDLCDLYLNAFVTLLTPCRNKLDYGAGGSTSEKVKCSDLTSDTKCEKALKNKCGTIQAFAIIGTRDGRSFWRVSRARVCLSVFVIIVVVSSMTMMSQRKLRHKFSVDISVLWKPSLSRFAKMPLKYYYTEMHAKSQFFIMIFNNVTDGLCFLTIEWARLWCVSQGTPYPTPYPLWHCPMPYPHTWLIWKPSSPQTIGMHCTGSLLEFLWRGGGLESSL